MEDFHSILILMVVVWVMGKVFRMLTLPVLFGELLGGVIVGPAVLGLVAPNSEAIRILSELGIFFLMLHAGLETDPHELAKGSKKSVLIAVGGMVLPFIGGFFVSQAFDFSLQQSLFVAIAISVTAIAISVRILKDYNLQNTGFGHRILGAAILSDIVILIVFSVMLNIFDTGNFSALALLIMLLKILLFFGVIIFGGIKFQKYFSRIFRNKGFTLTLIIALALGLFAELIGLHVIIGAFLAGLFIREEQLDTKTFNKIEDRVYGLSYSFLGPIFFTSLAFNIDFRVVTESPLLLIALFTVAFFGKLIGSGGACLIQKQSRTKALLTGLTMNSRGTVDLVIFSIALQRGIINKELFSALVLVVFTATLVSILLIKPLSNKLKFS